MSELPQQIAIDLPTVLKAIRNGNVDRVARPIYEASRSKLRSRSFRRAGVKLDVDKAAMTTPSGGSDSLNLRGVLRWIENVRLDDPQEVDKLQQVCATAQAAVR